MSLIHRWSPLFSLVLLGTVFVLGGCSSFREEKNEAEFEYEPPDPYEFEEPEVIEAARYLPISPSGQLYSLEPARIAVTDVPEFTIGSNPKIFLKNLTRKFKRQGLPFLPYHYYLSPDGTVFEGMNADHCGYLEGKRISDTLIVGVLGSFDGPTEFLPPEQEKALVQLLAWLCREHSVQPENIFPANEIQPTAHRPGANLMNWFGPTQTLRQEVAETLKKGEAQALKEAQKSSHRRKPPDISTLF